MRFIDPKTHGVIDYLAVAVLAASPFLFGFAGTTAATLAYGAAIAQLSLSLFTAYPMGVIRAIPFPIHGMIELSLGLFLSASPWIFGFDEMRTPRNFYLLTGASLFFVWVTTNYEAAISHHQRLRVPRDLDEEMKKYHKRAA
jgi:hypothetical protein